MENIIKTAYSFGAKAAFLSGSGPTILALIEGNMQEFEKNINMFFKENKLNWKCRTAKIDNVGAVVKNCNSI